MSLPAGLEPPPKELTAIGQLVSLAAVAAGEAESVSAYVNDALCLKTARDMWSTTSAGRRRPRGPDLGLSPNLPGATGGCQSMSIAQSTSKERFELRNRHVARRAASGG